VYQASSHPFLFLLIASQILAFRGGHDRVLVSGTPSHWVTLLAHKAVQFRVYATVTAALTAVATAKNTNPFCLQQQDGKEVFLLADSAADEGPHSIFSLLFFPLSIR
jgi:hypothetical protein